MKRELYGVPIDILSRDQLATLLRGWMSGGQRVITTPNPEMLLLARQDAQFCSLLQSSDLCLPDGAGLRFASAAFDGEPIRFRHTGVDTVQLLAQMCTEEGKRLILFGGKEGSADGAAAALREDYPNLDVVPINPGDVNVSELDEKMLAMLQNMQGDILAVALGHGKQERFIQMYKQHLPATKMFIGIGGALEMISGQTKRAPEWMRAIGMEWLWRLALEPARAPRIVRAVIVFPVIVAYDTVKQRRIWHALPRVAREVFNNFRGK